MIDFLATHSYEVIICTILAVAIISIYSNYKNSKVKKTDNETKLEKENRELKKLLYPNRNYKCKGIEYYAETPRERLIRIFDEMDPAGQDKLCDYAEKLERDRENSKYY